MSEKYTFAVDAVEVIPALVEALQKARWAIVPLAELLPQVEAFVESRAKSANDVSPIMPTRHFRLDDFRRAHDALAAIDAALAKVTAP